MREFTKVQSCQTLYLLRCGDDNGGGFAPPTTSGFLGYAGRETRGKKVNGTQGPTQTNTADGSTKALQTAKDLEWRDRLSMGYDSGDDG